MLLVFALACTDPRDEQFSCPDGACPSGFFCWSDGLCHDEPENDAGPEDVPLDVQFPDANDADLPDVIDVDAHDAGPPVRAVDLLLVIDDSRSMEPAQTQLAGAFEPLVLGLIAGNYQDQSFEPITDLQVGVVSTDMGVGGFLYPGTTGCNSSDFDREFGDDGVLRTNLEPTMGCASWYPAILSLDPSMASAFVDDVECKSRLGINGCGFEQPLEAMLKAITPATSTIDFYGMTRGHGDGVNAGMVRDDSVLVVIVLSDEEDCSTPDPRLFDPDPDSEPFGGVSSTRCIDFHATGLHPISRYVDGLRALRPGAAGKVVFGAIVGLPTDVDPSDFDALQTDPRMVPALDDLTPRAVCTGPVGFAGAAPRYVDTAQRLDDLGSRAVLESICVPDYRPFFGRVISEVIGALQL